MDNTKVQDDTKVKDDTKVLLPTIKQSKPRCKCCKKKLKMTELNFKCKCSYVFCQLHLNPHSHACTYDYQNERKKMIEQSNPKMCVKIIDVN